jgi:hypothetical protein
VQDDFIPMLRVDEQPGDARFCFQMAASHQKRLGVQSHCVPSILAAIETKPIVQSV